MRCLWGSEWPEDLEPLPQVFCWERERRGKASSVLESDVHAFPAPAVLLTDTHTSAVTDLCPGLGLCGQVHGHGWTGLVLGRVESQHQERKHWASRESLTCQQGLGSPRRSPSWGGGRWRD